MTREDAQRVRSAGFTDEPPAGAAKRAIREDMAITLWVAAESALAGEPLPDEANRIFAEAFAQYLRYGRSMDAVLGLRTPGNTGRSLRLRYLTDLRNRHLRCAWECLDEPKPWHRSKRLATEVRCFETIIYPRWRRNLPESPSALRLALFNAFQCRVGVPGSAQKLHEIVTRTPPSPVIGGVID